jgi:hypothetical protein
MALTHYHLRAGASLIAAKRQKDIPAHNTVHRSMGGTCCTHHVPDNSGRASGSGHSQLCRKRPPPHAVSNQPKNSFSGVFWGQNRQNTPAHHDGQDTIRTQPCMHFVQPMRLISTASLPHLHAVYPVVHPYTGKARFGQIAGSFLTQKLRIDKFYCFLYNRRQVRGSGILSYRCYVVAERGE